MGKRFTDTNKYRKKFYRTLPGAYKLLWDFLYHDCDHAGIWIVDFETAQIFVGKDMLIELGKAEALFNADEIRVIPFDNGKKWFIPSFITFQYGKLSEKNRAHSSVIEMLKRFNLIDADLSPINKLLKPLWDYPKGDKDKDMDKDKESVLPQMTKKEFDVFHEKMVADTLFTEPLFMSSGIKNNDSLISWLYQYDKHIAGEGKLNKDYSDYKRHFKNWLNKKDTYAPPPLVNGSHVPSKPVTDEQVNKYRKNV